MTSATRATEEQGAGGALRPGFSDTPAFAVAAAIAVLGLGAVQLGLVPPLRYAWALNFWQYFDAPIAWIALPVVLALCLPAPRRRVAAQLRRVASRLPAEGVGLDAALFVLAVAMFWVLRERQLFGDSALFLAASRSDWTFVFPEIGSTFLMRASGRLLEPLGFRPSQVLQGASCVFGGIAVVGLRRACGWLAGGRGALALGLTALVLTTGLARVFAGHIETYPPLLAAVAFYVWAAFSRLEGDTARAVPALVLGVAIWLHLAALFLLPSLLALDAATGERDGVRGAVRQVAIAAIPSVVFLIGVAVLAGTADLEAMWAKAMQVLGGGAEVEQKRWWVRLHDGQPIPPIGIDYVFLSQRHLKFLANAYWLLAGVGGVVVVAFGIARPRAFVATPALRFLLAATVPMVVYSLMLRPFWGPFDWDLFSASALCLSLLGAALLAHGVAAPDRRAVLVLAIAIQLVFLSGPFLALGVVHGKPAGPFVKGSFYQEIGRETDPPHGRIAPWL